MRPLIALLLSAGLMIGGCHRQSEPAPQGNRGVEEMPATAGAANTSGNEVVEEEEIGTLDRSHKGEAAPDFPFENPAGAKVTLASFRGKPVLLNLWATYCAPCVKEMPTLDALSASIGDKVEVLTLSQDFKGAEVVDPFFQKAGYKKLQPYLDKEAAFVLSMNVNLPTTILYDSQGREVWRMLGGMDWTGQHARELIAEAS